MESKQPKRAALIYNPVARGLSRHPHLLQRTIGTLSKQGIEARLVPTDGPGTAGMQAQTAIESGADLIIAAGGDGTINEVANGMLYTDVPLAILPGGTANVLAREMRLPIHLDRAASQIAGMDARRIAVGGIRLSGSPQRCFLCMAGAGLDAAIVSRLNLRFKARTGKLAYYLTGFSQVFQPLHEFDVIIEGLPYQASFALISRVRNYGGDLEIARGASLLRDDFEIVLFRGTMSVRYLGYLLGVALGRVHRMRGSKVVRGRKISCPGNDGTYVQIDGELAGRLPLAIEILPEALTLLLPAGYLRREQARAGIRGCDAPPVTEFTANERV
ncbi:MAG: YegS/Rv2252/BmrU family lipid kinase [Acidobacteriaceae bacterium]|nr:YegS/Rv2252/BmrU family lipid kinase [Acidobacteriaceae bacterium]